MRFAFWSGKQGGQRVAVGPDVAPDHRSCFCPRPVGVLYIAAVLPTMRSARPAFTLQVAAVSSALVIAGAFPGPTASLLTPYAFANRAMALITIWVTAILVRNYRQRIVETARLAALVTSSDDAILSTTLEGKIETWNAGAEHLCAYQAAEIMGQPLSVLLPE